MRALIGQQVLMRIFIGETDRHGAQPLYKALVDLFRREKLAGATVLRGICGFGAKSHLHTTHLLQLSQNLPIVVREARPVGTKYVQYSDHVRPDRHGQCDDLL